MPDQFQFDVFLSHNSKDKPRVRKLAEQLKAAGLRVWFDEWVIQPGDIISLKVDEWLERSRVLLLCLSPAALASDWVSLERSTAIHRDPANAGRRFIPLLLADCELPDTLRRYKYVDFRKEAEGAFAELLSACEVETGERPPTARLATKKKPTQKETAMNECVIVVFSANPTGSAPLALDEEVREIEAKIRGTKHRDNMKLISKCAVRPDDLLQALNEHDATIVHFSGHGAKSDEIILVDDDGSPKPVSKDAMSALLRAVGGSVRLVVLNACYSKPQAEAIVEHVDCAIGMNKAVGDSAAITFAASLYRAIGFGKSVQDAFDQGIAAMLLDGSAETTTPELHVKKNVDPRQVFPLTPARCERDSERQRTIDYLHGQLMEHLEFQRWQFEDQRVLGQEPFSLRHVYVDTDCGVLRWGTMDKTLHETGTPVDPFVEFSPECGGRFPSFSKVIEFIEDPDFDDVIVIQGHAGAGKSALTLRLCDKLRDLDFCPIRIELKELNVSDTSLSLSKLLTQAIRIGDRNDGTQRDEYFVRSCDVLVEAISKSIRRIGSMRLSNYVLILDAWDEVSIGATLEYQQAIEELLEKIRTEFFSDRYGFNIRVILTGRPSEAVTSGKFLKPKSAIITLRPFTKPQLLEYVEKIKNALLEKPLAASKHWIDWNLNDDARLKIITDRYEHTPSNSTSDSSSPNSMYDILGLPLLCYLSLRLFAVWEENLESVLGNSTLLYRSLVDLLIAAAKPTTDPNSKSAPAHIEGKQLRQILRATAEAITVRGRESIKFVDLQESLGNDKIKVIEELGPEQALSRLVISFFFKGGQRDLGCEFSHKSFREYLFAEQVVEVMKEFAINPRRFSERAEYDYWEDFNKNDPRFNLSRRVFELFGRQWLKSEVAQHITCLIALEIERSCEHNRYPIPKSLLATQSKKISVDDWERIRDALCDLWDWWGKGVHLRHQPDVFRLDDVGRVDDNQGTATDKQPTPRIIFADGYVGDPIFQICCDVHRELLRSNDATNSKDLLLWNQRSDVPVRRHQRTVGVGNYMGVVFRPSGDDGRYLLLYIHRINGTGFRPKNRGAFPRPLDLSKIDFQGVDLRFCDFATTDFSSSNFQESDLSGSNLENCNLCYANLVGAKAISANLRQANFSNADLRNADFSNSNLSGAVFTNANMECTAMRGASLTHCNFENARLSGAYLNDANLCHANFRNAELSGCILANALLIDADLSDAFLRGAVLDRANLTKANLTNASLKGTSLTACNLTDASLPNINLSERDLAGVNFTRAFLDNANLHKAYLHAAVLTGASLVGADLSNAKLTGQSVEHQGANLVGANLENADLSNADLKAAVLYRANLKNANLEGANLSNAKLLGANLEGANLRDAHLWFAEIDKTSLMQAKNVPENPMGIQH